jgi:juvenile hormone epoxide hydrolase
LKRRLEDVDEFTEPLEDTAFEYGFNSNRLKEVIDYWKNVYLPKWEERQEYLNKFDQYDTQIQGLMIHYLRVKPKVNKDTKVFPLLLLHGWPGSVREFYEIIPFLTTPSKDNIAFEVIAPSLPGFGFSQGAKKKGLSPDKIAVIMRNLMERIGIEKYYIQAGDWVRES